MASINDRPVADHISIVPPILPELEHFSGHIQGLHYSALRPATVAPRELRPTDAGSNRRATIRSVSMVAGFDDTTNNVSRDQPHNASKDRAVDIWTNRLHIAG
jgi:hypothetical protein